MWENSFTLYNIYMYIVAGVTSCTSQTICKKKFLFFTQNTSSQLQSTMAAAIGAFTGLAGMAMGIKDQVDKDKKPNNDQPPQQQSKEDQSVNVHDTVTNGPQNNVAGDGNQTG